MQVEYQMYSCLMVVSETTALWYHWEPSHRCGNMLNVRGAKEIIAREARMIVSKFVQTMPILAIVMEVSWL